MKKKSLQKFSKLLILLGSLFLFLFSPQVAEAGPCDYCGVNLFCYPGCMIMYIASLPVRIIFFLIILPIALTALGLSLVLLLLNFAIQWLLAVSVNIKVSPANPLTTDLVKIGWTFTRDFANMFFVLALLMIGLATILKIQDYQAKKALPRLIIIALLINFTPVIVGFVVDIANIFTKFFIDNAGELSFNFFDMCLNWFTDSVVTIFEVNGRFITEFVDIALPPLLEITLKGIILVFFFGYSIYVYFLIMMLFFLRIVWLWLLMILAPIAFLSYVFPQNEIAKNFFPDILHWDKWWQELIKWAIVGIPLGFFIYLASWVFTYSAAVEDTFLVATLDTLLDLDPGSGLNETVENIAAAITSIVPPLVGIVILHQGYELTKKVGPSAASGLIKGVEGMGKKAKGAALMMAGYGAGAVARKAKSGAKLGAGRIAGGTGRVLSRIPGLRRVSRGLVAREEKAREEYAKRKRELPPEFDKMRKKNKQAWLKGANKSQLIMAASEDRDALSIINEEGNEKLKNKLISAAKSKAGKSHYKSAIKKLQQQFPEELGGFEVGLKLAFDKERFKKRVDQIVEDCGLEGSKEEQRDMATQISILKGARKKDIEEMSTDILKSKAARITSKNYWKSSNVLAVHEKLDKESWKNFFEGEGGINNVKAKKLLEKNPNLARSFHFNRSMRALGYKDMKGLKKKIEDNYRTKGDEGPPGSHQTTLDDYTDEGPSSDSPQTTLDDYS